MAEDDTNTTSKKRVLSAPANAPSRRGGRGGKFMNICLQTYDMSQLSSLI